MTEYTIGEIEGIAALGASLGQWLESPRPERTEAAELSIGDFRMPVTDDDGNIIGELVAESGGVTFNAKESK